MQADWFGEVASVPSGHGVHARSTVAEPARLTNVPGGQVFHAPQTGASSLSLKCPLGHAEHAWSWGEPAAEAAEAT